MSTHITVIVPVYNIEDYLERCINSILNQTYRDFDLILVDDGSTDKSGSIADRFAKNDSRIKVVHKTNGGSSSARNAALDIATGEYISFVDSDDYIEPDFLEKLVAPVEKAKENGSDIPMIIQIGRDEIDEDGNKRPDICIPPKEETLYDYKSFLTELLMHKGDCSFCTKIVDKELFATRRFPVGKLNEDFHLLIGMLMEKVGVTSLPGYKYHVFYRMGSNSRKKSRDEFSRVYADNIENADMVEELVKEKMPELCIYARRFALFQRLDYLLHIPIGCMNKEYAGYKDCVGYLRKHFFSMIRNRYLTVKNKLYLTLFAIAPKTVRVVHAKTKHL